jgi:ATP-dependent Clp protease protease subunit
MGCGYRIMARSKTESEVLLYEDIGAGMFGGLSAKQFSEDLKKLGPVNLINVRINSYGGDVFDGLAIYRQLAEHTAKKVVHVDGMAASIASVIAMAGNEIRISEAATMMIHDAWGMVRGNAAQLRDMAEKLDMVSGAIADVYAARTLQKRSAIVDWMNKETWMQAAQAVERGFATSIVANVKVAAHA